MPVKIDFPKMDSRQKAIVRAIVANACKPIDSKEFATLWTRLRVLAVPRIKFDDELAMNAYYDELCRYPADVVRYAMKRVYKWFPSFAELKDVCDTECRLFDLLKNELRG